MNVCLDIEELSVIYQALAAYPQARQDRLFDAGNRAIRKIQAGIETSRRQPPRRDASGEEAPPA